MSGSAHRKLLHGQSPGPSVSPIRRRPPCNRRLACGRNNRVHREVKANVNDSLGQCYCLAQARLPPATLSLRQRKTCSKCRSESEDCRSPFLYERQSSAFYNSLRSIRQEGNDVKLLNYIKFVTGLIHGGLFDSSIFKLGL